MKLKYVLIYILALAVAVFIIYRTAHHDYYNAVTVTGATPLAVAQSVPKGYALRVDGRVKNPYHFSTSALRAFATTRIRTKELNSEGVFEGTYMYIGIPVYNILEGVAPAYPEDAALKMPTDMLVTFTSRSGEKVHFSYGELIMVDDSAPVTLAFDRKELLPTGDPESYHYNIRGGPLTGFRLIAPKEPDISRYLDDVVSMELSVLDAPDDLLPVRNKGLDCSSAGITGIVDRRELPTDFQGLDTISVDRWIRVGHGQGYKGMVSARGYRLRDFLKKNFPFYSADDYFLFVSCDGYRCLFSGREIFTTQDGCSMLFLTEMDNKQPPGDMLMACLDDYFIDRSIWGVSHVVILRP
ncbi:MAG: hypothetical protein JW920_02590 [Deltaproteobacteria bacterium]|nr:hypothetical protein [Deltaproteobacteria bacterium]